MRNVIQGLVLLAGAVMMLAGFIVFQWISVLGFGRTGLQIVLENQQSLPSQLMLQPEQPLWTLWLVPLVAIGALLVGWRVLRMGGGRRTLLTVLLFALGLVALYPFWVTYSAWTVDVVDIVDTRDILASGFWLALAGDVLVTLAALVSSR